MIDKESKAALPSDLPQQTTDGTPAECHWLTVAPRAGLQAHRRATTLEELRQDSWRPLRLTRLGLVG